MKSKKQKRIEAMERAESYSFENSKLYRNEGNSPDVFSKWLDRQAAILVKTKEKGV